MGAPGGSLIAAAVFGLFLAGYISRYYGLPPPPPKIAGIDLGTTYSSIGIYHAVTGETTIIPDSLGKRSIPSVVAFLPDGTVLVGTKAVEQQEKNPQRTIYDAKRFIGRVFEANNENFLSDKKRYPFTIKLDQDGHAFFEIPLEKETKKLYPEEVGSIIIDYLMKAAEKVTQGYIPQIVISVPAEFGENQRNATAKAAKILGLDVRRVVSEPTAAALSYGLHKKKGVESIVVVDLGGGTLDVSVLWLQGGVFITQAMAGNNRLGGQDFNNNIQRHILKKLETQFGKMIEDKEDIQHIRMEIEKAKIRLTTVPKTEVKLKLKEIGDWKYELTRTEFEKINEELLKAVEQPIGAALEDAQLTAEEVDEIVLVGGSTQMPIIRKIVGTYFGKSPNFGIDPELAVVTGAAVQAGVIGGGWPLQVAAMELPPQRRKRHFFTEQQKINEEEK